MRVNEERGFTLVEVAVAGFLLVVGILGGVSVFDSSRRESDTGERQQLAVLLAEEELERVRDVPYGELAVEPPASGATTGAWQASGAPGDPTDRVVAGSTPMLRTGPNDSEELLFASATGAGIAGQSSFPAEAGGTTLDADVYRFVSWRDVECPVADLSGITGPLQTLTTSSNTLLTTLLAGNSTLNNLLGPLLNILNSTIKTTLQTLKTELNAVNAQVADVIAAVGAMEEIDPCDADVDALDQAQDSLSALNPVLSTLNTRLTAYRAGCTTVAGIVISCPGTGSSLWTNLNSTISQLISGDFDGDLNDLVDSLGEVSLTDTTHNTKRVTIAVVLTPRTGSGPSKPVWATSVVSDPYAGLLTSP